ncbi:MAG: 4-hydroxy-tetrahydrodipicolinate reductase [Patescibacteria group bacterium]
MNIALVGFGKVGREIASIVEQSTTDKIVSVSYGEQKELDIIGIQEADVVIDFTSAAIVLENIPKILELKKPLVIGTTGWYDNLDQVKDMIKKENGAFVYGPNFSIGVNIFYKLTGYASKLAQKFEAYDVYGFEVHHTAKKDSPSGTAKKLTSIILESFPAKKVVQTDAIDRPIKKEELHFASLRGGHNRGRHEVTFDSIADEISLTHQSRGGRGFAEGALVAARFIHNKKGFYSFDDVFEELIV